MIMDTQRPLFVWIFQEHNSPMEWAARFVHTYLDRKFRDALLDKTEDEGVYVDMEIITTDS